MSAQANQAKGHPDAPLTAQELQEKFCANVALAGMGTAEGRELAGGLLALDRCADIGPILQALRRPQARTPLARD